MEKQDIGEMFLITFVNALATAKRESLGDIPQVYPEFQESVLKTNHQEKTIQMLPEFLKPIQIKKQFTPLNNPVPVKINQQPNINNYIRENTIPKQVPILKSGSESLNMLIRDPSVNEIECIDADNPLIVKRSGMTQKTQIKLSVEEIYELIAEFSQKTRIPVINGTIKAAINNLIITAVLSESLGPRFIIQKKKPTQQLII